MANGGNVKVSTNKFLRIKRPRLMLSINFKKCKNSGLWLNVNREMCGFRFKKCIPLWAKLSNGLEALLWSIKDWMEQKEIFI